MTTSSTLPNSDEATVIFMLRISSGSFANGFNAILDILQPGQVNPQQRYQLLSCPELSHAYDTWHESYQSLRNTRTIEPVAGQTTQHGYAEELSNCRIATVNFEEKCSEWFRQPSFEALRFSVVQAVERHQLQQVPVLLEANTGNLKEDILLRKLPWHLWALFDEDLRSSEMILNARVTPSNYRLTAPINILAVFGSQAGGLQLDGDLGTLETHLAQNGAKLVLLVQPSPRKLQEALWNKPWDILFFAGHSQSCNDGFGGTIQLSDGVDLELRDLRNSLNKAVENGLKLAIFNSCDGLSLAEYLADRKVPISVVMKEPIPDRVARYFLECFLRNFSQGQLNLQAAVRIAREQLQWLENDGIESCPAATWLPVICQNPNQSPLFWPPAIRILLRKETVLLALLIILGLGGGIVAVWRTIRIDSSPADTSVPVSTKKQSAEIQYSSLEDRFSEGKSELIKNESNYIPCGDEKKSSFETAKSNGIKAMQRDDYASAIKSFNEAWDLCRAPEVLIYRNNARIGSSPALTLAIPTPIEPQPKNAIEMLRGSAQAQTLINASGGVKGTPVKLIIIDDGDDPEIAKDIATKLSGDPEVLAVIGHWTSGVTQQAADVYNGKEALVFMMPISIVGDIGKSGWVLRATIDASNEAEVLADHLLNEEGSTKVAIFSLYPSSVNKGRAFYSEGSKNAFTKAFEEVGGEIVASFDLASKDFKSNRVATARKMVLQAKGKGADTVLVIPDNSLVPNAEEVIKQAKSQLLTLVGVTNLYREEFLSNTCSDTIGMILSVAWQADGEANQDFVETAELEFWKGEVNFATAMTYNAVQAVAAAMREQERPTREGIHEALNRPGFSVQDTADVEPLEFENGSRQAKAQLAKVVKKKDSNLDKNSCEFVSIPP